MKTKAERNEHIRSMIGKKSLGLIAKELNISRSTVAGVIWREKVPPSERHLRPQKHAERTLRGTRRS